MVRRAAPHRLPNRNQERPLAQRAQQGAVRRGGTDQGSRALMPVARTGRGGRGSLRPRRAATPTSRAPRRSRPRGGRSTGGRRRALPRSGCSQLDRHQRVEAEDAAACRSSRATRPLFVAEHARATSARTNASATPLIARRAAAGRPPLERAGAERRRATTRRAPPGRSPGETSFGAFSGGERAKLKKSGAKSRFRWKRSTEPCTGALQRGRLPSGGPWRRAPARS